MRLARSILGKLGIAAVCLGLTASVSMASEVLEILSDLESDFRASYQQLAGFQTRLDQLQLGNQLDKAPPSVPKIAADLQSIGSGSAKTLDALRAKVQKLDEMRANLEERFPEDREEIAHRFAQLADLLAKSETLYQGVRQDLDQARAGLVASVQNQADPTRREQLIDSVRNRMAAHDRALARRHCASAFPETVAAAPDSGSDARADEPSYERPMRLATPTAAAAMAHPPISSAPVRPCRGSRDTSKPSVTVDLEQLIQEMEK